MDELSKFEARTTQKCSNRSHLDNIEFGTSGEINEQNNEHKKSLMRFSRNFNKPFLNGSKKEVDKWQLKSAMLNWDWW